MSLLTKYKRYLSNISWIMFEKIFTMGITFFVTILIARYLEPEKFGILSYSISLVAIFTVAGHLGLSGLIVKELLKNEKRRNETLGTTFILKSIGSAIGFVTLIFFAIFTEDTNSIEFLILIVASFSLLIQPLKMIDFWFQSYLQSKYISLSNIISVIITSIYKMLLVFFSGTLLFFAFANVIQVFISVIIIVFFYINLSDVSIKSWYFSKLRAKELLSQGWMIFLGAIFSIIYLKIDQIMLKWIAGNEEVGVYAVASTLSEAWYFVPVAIVTSFYPKLIQLRDSNKELYLEKLQKLFTFLFLLALIVAIFVTYFSDIIILTFFGERYVNSVSILTVHIWAAIFIFMRAAFSRWILIENELMFSLLTQGFGALTNVMLNYFLIPHWGGIGAAVATLISYAFASYISLLFYSKTRSIFLMMTNSIISPIILPIKYIKGKFND
jgi:O-antigen/teichoic acid export membrane protein